MRKSERARVLEGFAAVDHRPILRRLHNWHSANRPRDMDGITLAMVRAEWEHQKPRGI